MKNVLKYLPIVLYPYLYVPLFAVYIKFLEEKDNELKYLLAIIIACNVICFLSSIIGTIQVIRGKIDSRKAIKANLPKNIKKILCDIYTDLIEEC